MIRELKYRLERVVAAILILFLSTMCDTAALAQSLSQQLKAEPVEKLAQVAREKGNAVRGAILFTQQNLACTQCHAAVDNKSLGPDLTRLDSEVTDVYLVEALLDPSKMIRKGFESVAVETTTGKVVVGRIVEQNADRLTIRSASGDLPLLTIANKDIEEIASKNVSAMPDKLIDQLKDRAEFLDLVRYLMELAAAKTQTQQVHSLGGKTIGQELEGVVLLKEYNCSACHKNDTSQNLLSDKRAPELSWSSGRIDPNYIERFIADPLHIKPGSTMPDVMGILPEAERKVAAEEITHYLVSLSDRSYSVQPIDAEAAERGRELFHTVGCVACHSPRDNDGRELLENASVPLGTIEHKYNTDGLVAFLKNPLEVRPSGRMPQLKLTHWESIDIASYLLSKAPQEGQPIKEPFKLNQALAEKGKVRFEQLGCRQCHQRDQQHVTPTSLPLSKLNPDGGCLSETAGKWPKYNFNAAQREAIRTALTHEPRSLNKSEQIAVTLTAFRCLNCHQRDDLGGVSAERNPHFKTTNPNLGPQGSFPPTLTGVGAKLNPNWMRQVLVSGRTIRPYVLTRMPQYGTDNVAHLVDLFQQVDQLPAVQFAKFKDQKEMRKLGAEMVGTEGLNCIVCHTFQLKKAANMPAVDLTEMAERLQKNWFYHYMREPQRLSPNTIMPSFWPGGRAMRKDILNGDTDLQIEALWQYLLDGRQAETPHGLIREPLELLATDEAVMLRRSYPGIGKRGIGVGYPNQVNLAFDAEQMRLAMIWKGKFADPGGVWGSQGHGVVRPLGDSLIQFAPGPDLDDAEKPWIIDEGRPPHHQFKGYSLDAKMRPRFKYLFSGISVEDYSLDILDSSTGRPFIRRTVSLSSNSNQTNLIFRAATGKKIEHADDGSFLVDDSLRVVVDEEHTGKIVDGAGFKQLQIPLQVIDGSSELTLEYKW